MGVVEFYIFVYLYFFYMCVFYLIEVEKVVIYLVIIGYRCFVVFVENSLFGREGIVYFVVVIEC